MAPLGVCFTCFKRQHIHAAKLAGTINTTYQSNNRQGHLLNVVVVSPLVIYFMGWFFFPPVEKIRVGFHGSVLLMEAFCTLLWQKEPSSDARWRWLMCHLPAGKTYSTRGKGEWIQGIHRLCNGLCRHPCKPPLGWNIQWSCLRSAEISTGLLENRISQESSSRKKIPQRPKTDSLA